MRVVIAMEDRSNQCVLVIGQSSLLLSNRSPNTIDHFHLETSPNGFANASLKLT